MISEIKGYEGLYSIDTDKTIEVDTFGESKDQLGNVSLNCPIFRGVRYDK